MLGGERLEPSVEAIDQNDRVVPGIRQDQRKLPGRGLVCGLDAQ